MFHPHAELRWVNDQIGRGVFATQRIPKGTIVWTLCKLDIVKTVQEIADLGDSYKEIFDIYGYLGPEGRSVLCWDIARFTNHSCNASTLPVGHFHEIAIRDIAAGEEITCDYRTLNYPESMTCHCGTPRCDGQIRAISILNMDKSFTESVNTALKVADTVEQPLLAFSQCPQEWIAAVGAQKTPLTARDFYLLQPVAA